MEKRKIMAAALLPAIMIVLVGYLSFRLHEANEYLRDRIYYSSARLQDYLILMRAMKKEHPPERDYVKRFNIMLNAELSFVEHDWTWFFDGDDDGKDLPNGFAARQMDFCRPIAIFWNQRRWSN